MQNKTLTAKGKASDRRGLYGIFSNAEQDLPDKVGAQTAQTEQSAAAARAAARAAAYQSLLAAQRQAAQDSYQRSLAALNATYTQRAAQRQAGYQDTLKLLQQQYDAGAAQLDAQTGSALQQAYLSYMLSLRDLPQQLAALGINGGGSESRLAGLKNSYGASRSQLEAERLSGLAALLSTLNEGKADALADYRSALAEDEARRMAYQLELEQNLASELAKIFSAAL